MVGSDLDVDLRGRGDEDQRWETSSELILTLKITRQSGIIIPPMSVLGAFGTGAIEYSTMGDKSIVATGSCSSI